MTEGTWEPSYDEDGKPVPITYLFAATDHNENTVGQNRECVEERPASEDMLQNEAAAFATAVAKAHPESRPWVGWIVEVGALNLLDEPAQVCKFQFSDLL